MDPVTQSASHSQNPHPTRKEEKLFSFLVPFNLSLLSVLCPLLYGPNY